MSLSFLILIACIPVFSKAVSAVEPFTIENDQVIVQFEKPLRAAAKEIIRIYPSIKQELENTFKSKIDFKPTVRIIKDRKTFQEMIGNKLVVAVAISRNNLIIIDNSRMKTGPFTLEVTLKHELCHLFLHNFIKGNGLPRWFNEGVSQWVSNGITEIIMDENRDLLKQASLSGRLIPLQGLNERFPEDRNSLLLAYQESKSIVNFIDKEFGPDGILRIMNYLRDGYEIDIAVFKALSISAYHLEKRWHADLTKRFTWFTYLSSHLYQVLFSLAALILVYGFIRLLIRKRAYRDEEEEED